ncbi:MAG TPA: 2-oxoglutarate dehydrogenase, E2 component, dihydrolipoamide succinyltransferase [Actinomycetes bacterium]|nr:2-oxoglutarate dehydrogenase, E2 component, dihydrolipoamide succinyltransferase [Actinomycetes bacterium]
MSVSVKMPQLGESVTEGTVTRWLKKEGDEVATDEPLLEVSTDKVDTEIPSPSAGVLLRILAHEDETVAVGAELAVIGAANEAPLQPVGGTDDEPAADQAPAEAAPVPAVMPVETAPPADAPPAAAPPAKASSAAGSAGSSTSLVLPALGESVTEGTVTRWLKQVGDAVALDEPLVEVSTDKVDTEIPSPAAGVLTAISVNTDEVVEVGGQLGVISSGDHAAPASAPAAAPTPAAAAAPVATPTRQAPQARAPQAPAAVAPVVQPASAAPSAPVSTAKPAGTEGDDGVGYVTPLVRKLAAEYAVDLADVTGTGVGGRIRKQDVLEAAKRVAQQAASTASATAAVAGNAASKPSVAPSPLRGRTEKMSRLRKVIAERMVESLQVSAQLTTVVEVDVTAISILRQRAKADFVAREGVNLSFLPFFAKAAVEALKVHPSVNANIDTAAGTVTYHDVENLGVAVDTERGLLVPVIHQAGDLNIAGLAKRIADVADRTRNNKIAPDELSGGTFTLTNTGSRGALFDTPIINQPQVAILGTGTVVKRPVVVRDGAGADAIAVRSMVYLALTYDHRLVDGADAARFLMSIKERLEDGAFEADLGL